MKFVITQKTNGGNTMIKKIDTKVLAKQLKEAADYLADHKEQGGCFRFNTVEMPDKDINKDVCIVLGWASGYDAEPIKYCDEDYHLCVKVGYQAVNNIMQTDYDIDFNQVYDRETGDIYDTEIALYPNSDFEDIAERIVTEFNYVLSSWKSWAHE